MRFRLTHQIFMLFSFVIILSMLIFTLITSSRFDSIYAEVGVNSIKDYINYTEDSWSVGKPPIKSKYEYFYGNIHTNEIHYSENILNIFSNDEINYIIDNTIRTENSSIKVYKSNDSLYHLATKIKDDGSYIVAIGDNDLMKHYRNNSFFMFIIIYGVILVWGNAILGIWSQQIVSRLKKIQKAVTQLPAEQYQKEIIFEGDDEISELASSIETMRQEICHNEETKREIIQNVSHDIKTPIAVIKSYAEAIYDGIEDKEAALVIIKQAEILKNKTIQLLEYNKLEYLETKTEFEDVNMKELIENVVDYYRFQTNITFILELENVYFKGFSEHYRTVLTNIIDNGIRYAKNEMRIILKDKYLEIYNDGPGIDEEFIKTIFKPYEKGNKGQFGLGMAIVKRTLDHFKYNIEVVNREVGVSFIITAL